MDISQESNIIVKQTLRTPKSAFLYNPLILLGERYSINWAKEQSLRDDSCSEKKKERINLKFYTFLCKEGWITNSY